LQAADADDVSQNVLLKPAHHLRTFVHDSCLRFCGFPRTTVHNACKDDLAGKRRAVVAGADSGMYAVLASALGREDLATRLEEGFDLERLEMARWRVRRRAERTPERPSA
jgi:DNA-directed RNA polymerase specialized sigma24 family protein